MSRNRIRQTQSVQFQHLWKLIAVCSILTVFGLVFVYLHIRTLQVADEIKKLENALAQVKSRNSSLTVQIQHRKSPSQLQRQITAFRLGMVDMTHPGVAVLEAPATARRPDSMIARTPSAPLTP